MPAWQGEPQVTAHVMDLHAYLSARADGTLTPHEREAILSQARGVGAEALIAAELDAPKPLEEILGNAPGGRAAEDLYTLAFSIVRADEEVLPAERDYLSRLAAALGIAADTATRLEQQAAIEAPTARSAPTPADGAAHFALGLPTPATMEQPYLVVLSTRGSPEELLQDLRTFKADYPALLGEAKARVDRVHGLDGKTWHRLSLIPPQSFADAKALCSGLRAAGLSGCWVRPLPLGRSAQ